MAGPAMRIDTISLWGIIARVHNRGLGDDES